jgi:hypothetical protein
MLYEKEFMLDIVHALQERLNLAELNKIDPNDTRQTDTRYPADGADKLTQATLTAILAGIYKYGRTDEGATAILNNSSGNWTQDIFNGKQEEVALHIANYSSKSKDDVKSRMDTYATAAVKYIKECTAEKDSPDAVKTYLATQRHPILAYLPADLQIGALMNDDTMDDRTNKMDGPMSSFMHALGGAFSGSSDQEKDTWKEAKED